MTHRRPIDEQTLLQLATGELDATRRFELVQAALSNAELARDMKLAMRLAQPASLMASNLVTANANSTAEENHRGIFAMLRTYVRWPALTAATAAALFVGLNLRAPQSSAPRIALQNPTVISDRFGPAGGFEGVSEVSDRFSGGFETH